MIYYRVALSRHELLFRGEMSDKPPVYQWDLGDFSLKINPLPAAKRFLLRPRHFDVNRRPYSVRTIIEAYQAAFRRVSVLIELSTISRLVASRGRL